MLMCVNEPEMNVIRIDDSVYGSLIVTYNDHAHIDFGPPMIFGRFSDGRTVQIMSESQYNKTHLQPPDFGDDFVQAMLI